MSQNQKYFVLYMRRRKTMKNFRLLLICAGLLFLDMPSPFGACVVDNRPTLEINTIVQEESTVSFNEINSKIDSNVTTLDDFTVNNQVKKALKTGKYYSEEDKCYYEIEVTSYNIESINLIKNDRTKIEITLPYDFTEEDIIVYHSGKRNFIKLIVNVTVEYEIIIPEVQPE